MEQISFKINQKQYQIDCAKYPVNTTLNTFIREAAGLPGTKYMCLEGGCGACVCILLSHHPTKKDHQARAINSCLVLLNSCDGHEIITIEGLGNRKDGYHPIQARLAQLNGSQCGFCSPGFVMNMGALVMDAATKQQNLTMTKIEDSFAGNLCRCTGYRPILDAMKSFATNSEYDLCNDIEDLLAGGKKCLKMSLNCKEGDCATNQRCENLKMIHYVDCDGLEWFTATKINEIFEIFTQIGDKRYILVNGNTAYGIYRTPNDIQVYIDINKIEELHKYEITETELKLGSNTNLTDAIEIFKSVEKNPGFEYCAQLYKHFNWIAHVPVRNVGTLAGNLMIKHQHNEFQSDVFLLFETLQVKLTLMETGGVSKVIGLVEFLRTDMTKKLITQLTLPAYAKDEFVFDSYKITPRAQNAHAIVNGAFLIRFNVTKIGTTVKSAQICYGGIRPDFVHASQTEQSLLGKDIYEANVVETTFRILNEEIQPDWVLPDLSPEYRRLLACSLYYRFLLSHASSSRITKTYKSGGYNLERALSSGTQTFEMLTKDYPLRQPVNKLEGQIQTAGEAFYMNDLPHRPNELWAAFVHGTQIGFTIAKIDPSAALELRGVVAFYSAADIPGVNSFVRKNELFNFVADEEIFCSSVIKYYDQPIGMIVATSTKLAEKAAKLVKVMYEKPTQSMPICLGTEDVLAEKQLQRIHSSAKIDTNTLAGSQVLDDLASENIKILRQNFKGFLKLANQYHFSMEPQTTVCVPSDFGMNVSSSTQWMDLTQDTIARSLRLQQAVIQLDVPRLGGAFGCKVSRGNQMACAAALACYKLNVPIRFVQSIESMMRSVGKRFALYCDYDGQAESNGKIVRLTITFFSEAGCTLNESPVDLLLLPAWKNVYESNSNWKIVPNSVTTDAPSHTWMRGPGTVEAIAMIETIMEHIARKTKRDSVDVRLANIAPGNKMGTLLTDFVKNIDYANRLRDIKQFNKENRWRKRGLGICVIRFPIDYLSSFPATVAIYQDGTVVISHGGIEMGQGLNTKASQVAAYTLKIPLELVKVLPSNTLNGANAFTTAASVASESVCYAVKKACEILNERLQPVKTKLPPNSTWIQVTKAAFNGDISMIANSIEKAGDIKGYAVYGLACSDVEVDMLTGNIQLRRVDILEDTGESLSPWMDIGQIEGAFVQGLGYWLTEQLIFNRITGELLTDRTWNYKIPGAKDIPIDFRVNLLQKSPNPYGFLKSKTTGEPAICLAISAIFGIRRALDSAQQDANQIKDWYHLGAPTTTETILLNSGTTVNQFHL